MKTSVAAIKVLEEQGAKFVFGIPGGQTLYFTDALRKSNIRFIQTRHEGVAAGAADVYGGSPANPVFASATTGPGATESYKPPSAAR